MKPPKRKRAADKRKRAPDNPFIPSLVARGRHFADRDQEVKRIRQAYREPGARLVVYGERRMGKTSALDRAAELERKAGTDVAIATFATATGPADAARQIILAVREQLGRGWRRSLESIVGRLQGNIDIRPGIPPGVRISFGLREDTARAELIPDTLNAIQAQVASEGGHLALALDEFQRIHEWGGEDAEWSLKAVLEQHRSLSYVLAGSQRSLIEAMVTRKGRALWKQVEALAFGPIDPQEMAEWIHQEAARAGARLTLAACDEIVRLSGPRTRDVVQLAREAWFEGLGRPQSGPDAVSRALDRLVEMQGALYDTIWRERSPTEQRVLRAVAIDPKVALTGRDALKRYQLGPRSTVKHAGSRLVESEYLVALPEGGYAFDDPFFRRWIELKVLQDLGIRKRSDKKAASPRGR